MLKFIDRFVEKLLKKGLHKRREKIIHKTLSVFVEEYHPDPIIIKDLEKKLQAEADRIYAIIDKSILRERIKRAKYTFWVTVIASTIIVGIISTFSHGAALPFIPFILPILTALVAWSISLPTIPISYNQRIKGAMDSVVIAFKKEMNLDKENVDSLKQALNEINQKLEGITQKVEMLYQQQANQNLKPEDDSELSNIWLQTKQVFISADEKNNFKFDQPKKRKFHFWHKHAEPKPNLNKSPESHHIHKQAL